MDQDISTIAGTDVAEALTTHVQQSTHLQAAGPLRGSVLVLIQFDVAEEIRLDELRKIFPARTAEASFKKGPGVRPLPASSGRGNPWSRWSSTPASA